MHGFLLLLLKKNPDMILYETHGVSQNKLMVSGTEPQGDKHGR